MNAAHIHLVLNTIPGIAIALAMAAISFGMARRSLEVVRFGILLLIGVGVLTIAVYLSGKRAINIIGNVPGVVLPNVEAHEQAGLRALIAVEICAVAALGAFVWIRQADEIPVGVTIALLVVALAAFTVVTRTALLGGRIHHPEAGGSEAVIELPKIEAPAP